MSLVFYRIDQRGKCTMYIMFYMSVLPFFEGFRSFSLCLLSSVHILMRLLFLNIKIMSID
jgi:hypothetical protein